MLLLNRLNGFGAQRATFCTEAQALIARMTTEPTYYRKVLINRLIVDLKDAAIWSELDALYLFAAHASQAALLNWKSTSHTATTSATFTADRGFLGDGATTYIDTNCQGPSVADSDHAFGVWLNVDGADAGHGIGGDDTSYAIRPNGLGSGFYSYSGGAAEQSVVVANGLGFSAVTRTAAGSYTMQKDGAQTSKTAAVGGTTSAVDWFVLAANDGGGSPTGFSASRAAAAFIGSGLTTGQLSTMYSALSAYLAAVGGN